MIRRRKRKPSALNIFKPKHTSRREQKRAEYRVLRPQVRQYAWEHYGYRCVFPTCRMGLSLDAMHAHEVIFRSQLGSPVDKDNVVPLCGTCHDHIHRRLGGILKRIERTVSGELRFFERKTGSSPWMEAAA